MRYTPFQLKKVIRSVIAAFCLLMTTNIIAQLTHAEQFYSKGQTAYEAKNLQDAVDNYTLTLQENPNFADARFSRSKAFFAMGKMNRALYDLDDLIHSNPYDVRALEFRGQVYYDLRNYEGALIDFETVISHHRSPEGYLNVGLVANAMENPDAAIRAFSDALSMDPYLSAAYCGIADAYVIKGEDFFRQAFDNYSIALRYDREDAFTLRNRGKLHLSLGNFENAVQDFQASLSYEMNFEAYLHLAQCFLEQREWKKAHRSIRYAMELENDHPEVYFTLGLVEMETGKYPAAVESFWVAKGYDTKNPEYTRQIGMAEYLNGNPYGAVRAFNEYLDMIGKEDAEVQDLVTLCYENIEETDYEIQQAEDKVYYASPAKVSTESNDFSEDIFDKE